MNIVKADLTCLHQLTDLALKLWPHNTAEHLMPEFEALMHSEKDIVLLAEVEGTYAGFIHMSLRSDYVEGSDSSPVGYIEGIYVEEAYRNQGISRKLVESGEKWAVSLGCTQIASDTELQHTESQEFHKSIGFKEAGRIVAFIKDVHHS